MLWYLDAPAALGLEPAREGAGIGAIGPDQFQTWQFAVAGAPDEELRAEAVVQVGGVDMGKRTKPAASTRMCRLRPKVRFAAS